MTKILKAISDIPLQIQLQHLQQLLPSVQTFRAAVAEVQQWPLVADEQERLAVVRLLWQEHETAGKAHDEPEPSPFP